MKRGGENNGDLPDDGNMVNNTQLTGNAQNLLCCSLIRKRKCVPMTEDEKR